MSDEFEVKMVGTEFPAYTKSRNRGRVKKYFTNSTVSLLMANIGKVFLIHEEHNVGGGKIAGTVEAGDDPPVKKKKKKKTYAYGGRGSRKMWMNNK